MKKKQLFCKETVKPNTISSHRRTRKIKSVLIAIALSTTLLCHGCEKSEGNNYKQVGTTMETTTEKAIDVDSVEFKDRERALVVGGIDVYLDEVLYYGYTTQATYEIYYLTQNETLNWDTIVTEDITLEQAAKSKLYDEICMRQVILYLAVNPEDGAKYDVTPTEEIMEQVDKKVKEYISGTNKDLQERIDISEARLREIYLKDELYKAVVKQMEADGKKTEEIFKKWKEHNQIGELNVWKSFNFRKPIFTSLEETK